MRSRQAAVNSNPGCRHPPAFLLPPQSAIPTGSSELESRPQTPTCTPSRCRHPHPPASLLLYVTIIRFVSAFHCPQGAIPAGSSELESRLPPTCTASPIGGLESRVQAPTPTCLSTTSNPACRHLHLLTPTGLESRLQALACLPGSHFEGNGKPTQTISELPGFESGFSLMAHCGAPQTTAEWSTPYLLPPPALTPTRQWKADTNHTRVTRIRIPIFTHGPLRSPFHAHAQVGPKNPQGSKSLETLSWSNEKGSSSGIRALALGSNGTFYIKRNKTLPGESRRRQRQRMDITTTLPVNGGRRETAWIC